MSCVPNRLQNNMDRVQMQCTCKFLWRQFCGYGNGWVIVKTVYMHMYFSLEISPSTAMSIIWALFSNICYLCISWFIFYHTCIYMYSVCYIDLLHRKNKAICSGSGNQIYDSTVRHCLTRAIGASTHRLQSHWMLFSSEWPFLSSDLSDFANNSTTSTV